MSHPTPLVEFGLLFRARASSCPAQPHGPEGPSSSRGPPLLGFLLSRHNSRRAPLSLQARACRGRGLPHPRRAVPGVLAPFDGSGSARGTHEVDLARPTSPLAVTLPALRSLVPCCSRPRELFLEPSPPGEPCSLSRARCFLAGSRTTVAGATDLVHFRSLSPRRRTFATCLARRPTPERKGTRRGAREPRFPATVRPGIDPVGHAVRRARR